MDIDGIISSVQLSGDMRRRLIQEQGTRDFRHYWKKYFEACSAAQSTQGSCRVNGFIDAILVDCIYSAIRKIIIHNGWQTIIDCGCGDGSVTSPLINQGIRVIGIDFSEQMCKIANSRQIETFCEDINVLEDQSVNKLLGIGFESVQTMALLFCESLGCLPQPINTLLRIGNINPAASMIVSFPNKESILRQIVSKVERSKLNYFRLEYLTDQMFLRGRRINIISAIISVPFLFSFEIQLNTHSRVLKLLMRMLASNWVVVVEPER